MALREIAGARTRSHMLEAVPKSIFSSKFRLHQQNALLGELDTSLWREKARIEFWLVYVMWKRQQAAAS